MKIILYIKFTENLNIFRKNGFLRDPPVRTQPPTMLMLHAARKSIERPRINPCACRQDWCNSLRKEIIKIGPEGHLWRKGKNGNGLYQLRNRANNRNDVRTAALKGSAVIHLKVLPEDAEKDSLQFALHHWHEDESGLLLSTAKPKQLSATRNFMPDTSVTPIRGIRWKKFPRMQASTMT
jgi:hypothetical protein